MRFALAVVLVSVAVATAHAQDAPRDFAVDGAASRIYVVTHRTGLLSFLGHEHAILAHQWQAAVCWDGPAHAASAATFSVDAATLTIDADSARRLAGLGGGPSAGQRARIQQKMLESLDVQQFTEMRFVSDSVRPRTQGLVLFGRLMIKGTTNRVDIPLNISADGAGTRMEGRTSFRQGSFGIRPESIAGVVKVADRVDLHVRLAGRITSNPCR